jgi:hypothetical protein
MAYIYQKVVGNETEQCLILGMREALVYPLNLGTWKDIRVGYFYSFTSSGNAYDFPNDLATDETIVGGTSNYKLGGYWGFKDSGTGFPGQTGVFIGIGQPPGDGNNESYFTPSSNGWALAHNGGVTNLTYYSINTSKAPFLTTRNSLALPSSAAMVGTGTYCGFYAQKLVNTVNSAGKTGLFLYDSTQNNIAQPSITGLRAMVLAATYPTLLASGYCTSNFNGVTGNNVDLPQNLFFYMPQLKNRIRFHTIFVEKVS